MNSGFPTTFPPTIFMCCDCIFQQICYFFERNTPRRTLFPLNIYFFDLRSSFLGLVRSNKMKFLLYSFIYVPRVALVGSKIFCRIISPSNSRANLSSITFPSNSLRTEINCGILPGFLKVVSNVIGFLLLTLDIHSSPYQINIKK